MAKQQILIDAAEGQSRLTEVLATDTLDAERYRWLRDHCTDMENPSHTWLLEAPGELWDDAIDAAMVANNEVRGGPSGPSQRNEVERT